MEQWTGHDHETKNEDHWSGFTFFMMKGNYQTVEETMPPWPTSMHPPYPRDDDDLQVQVGRKEELNDACLKYPPSFRPSKEEGSLGTVFKDGKPMNLRGPIDKTDIEVQVGIKVGGQPLYPDHLRPSGAKGNLGEPMRSFQRNRDHGVSSSSEGQNPTGSAFASSRVPKAHGSFDYGFGDARDRGRAALGRPEVLRVHESQDEWSVISDDEV